MPPKNSVRRATVPRGAKAGVAVTDIAFRNPYLRSVFAEGVETQIAQDQDNYLLALYGAGEAPCRTYNFIPQPARAQELAKWHERRYQHVLAARRAANQPPRAALIYSHNGPSLVRSDYIGLPQWDRRRRYVWAVFKTDARKQLYCALYGFQGRLCVFAMHLPAGQVELIESTFALLEAWGRRKGSQF